MHCKWVWAFCLKLSVFGFVFAWIYVCSHALVAARKYIVTKIQEDTTHSAAPSKCIHSSTKKIHMDRTGTDKQNTSQASTTLYYVYPKVILEE
jgi:hypothetical protein